MDLLIQGQVVIKNSVSFSFCEPCWGYGRPQTGEGPPAQAGEWTVLLPSRMLVNVYWKQPGLVWFPLFYPSSPLDWNDCLSKRRTGNGAAGLDACFQDRPNKQPSGSKRQAGSVLKLGFPCRLFNSPLPLKSVFLSPPFSLCVCYCLPESIIVTYTR